MLTSLHESESIVDAALIALEEQSTSVDRRALLFFLLRDLGPKLDATTHDAVPLNRDAEVLEVCTGKRLPDVRGEGADLLEAGFRSEVEVVDSNDNWLDLCVFGMELYGEEVLVRI